MRACTYETSKIYAIVKNKAFQNEKRMLELE